MDSEILAQQWGTFKRELGFILAPPHCEPWAAGKHSCLSEPIFSVLFVFVFVFVFAFFETVFLCVALAVLELAL